MYRLNSAKHLFTGGGGGCFAMSRSYCRRVVAETDDFVYVGKGFKICNKEEIEVPISNNRSTKWNGSQNNIKKRKSLPSNLLSRYVVSLTCESTAAGGICDVYLVGTNHDLERTWEAARAVIKYLKPQVVYLELCSSRLFALTQQPDKVPTMGEMLDMWKKNEDPFFILLKWFQAKKMRKKTAYWGGGGECRVAYQEAMKYGGKVILGDVPQEINIRRILSRMSIWRYLFHPESINISEDFYKTAKDEIDRINLETQELIKRYPDYWEPYVSERDRYMSAKILKVAREHNSVVAIVGMAHLAGIQKNWKQPVDVKQLIDTGAHKVTIGRMINSFGAMVVYLCLSGSKINKIKDFLSRIL